MVEQACADCSVILTIGKKCRTVRCPTCKQIHAKERERQRWREQWRTRNDHVEPEDEVNKLLAAVDRIKERENPRWRI